MREKSARGNAGMFWISLFLTLAIIMPLLGCLVMYSGWQSKTQAQAAQKAQSGVPIDLPGPDTDITVLAAVAKEEPSFILLRFNAPKARLQISTIPGQSVLRSPSGPVILRESYETAGPGRAAQLLSETLDLTIDRYLAITPESIGRAWGSLEPPRINLSNILSSQELGAMGLKDDPVISLHPKDAADFITALKPGVMRKTRLEAAVWDAALRQQLEDLADQLPEGLRKESGSLLTDINAADFFVLQKSLHWLAKQETQVEAEPLPGHYDRYTDRYEFDTTSIAFIKENFAKMADRKPQTGIKLPAESTADEEAGQEE